MNLLTHLLSEVKDKNTSDLLVFELYSEADFRQICGFRASVFGVL